VGKTTTVIHLAHYFAQRGDKVLVVDLDTQGHVALSYDEQPGDALRDVLLQRRSIEQAKVEARPNLWIIPNSKSSEELTPYLMNMRQREYALANVLETIEGQYDWIFLDTPPSANILHDLALIASHYVIVPTLMDYFSIGGLSETLKTIQALGNLRHVTPPKLVGVLPTRHDIRTVETRRQMEELADAIGGKHILPPIPEDTKVREASTFGKTLWEYAPKTPALIGRPTKDKVKNSLGNLGGYLHLSEILAISLKE
jgi:chromosome partitioning protein